MIDINYIRKNPDAFDVALSVRGMVNKSAEIRSKDEIIKKLIGEKESYQTKRNLLSEEIGLAKRVGEDVSYKIEQVKELKGSIVLLEKNIESQKLELDQILLNLPNIPANDVPIGKSEEENKVIKVVGMAVHHSWQKEHDYILDSMDFTTAAKLSGARFVILKNKLAKLHRILIDFMIDTHVANGFEETYVPYLVRQECLIGTGQLPKFESELFKTTSGHYLIPTAEVPLTNIVSNSILEYQKLPLRLTAHTPCFRAEAGSAGKDTRGMIRQHQFEKVELVSITTDDMSEKEHQYLLSESTRILDMLEIPYRIVLLCTGDMGFSSQKTYDIEVWLPGQNRYREISSCSNCGSFQAIRMNAKYRKDDKLSYVHTLNSSALAVGRTLIAILENYQTDSGNVKIPHVLKSYFAGDFI